MGFNAVSNSGMHSRKRQNFWASDRLDATAQSLIKPVSSAPSSAFSRAAWGSMPARPLAWISTLQGASPGKGRGTPARSLARCRYGADMNS
ncbi:hypothetical protein D3C72_1906960 [compost metagenome]